MDATRLAQQLIVDDAERFLRLINELDLAFPHKYDFNPSIGL